MVFASDCLATTGVGFGGILLAAAAALLVVGILLFRLSRRHGTGAALMVLPLLLAGGILITPASSARADDACPPDTSSASSPSATPSFTPTPTPTPSADGLTLVFSPDTVNTTVGQYLWYCANGQSANVCASGQTVQLTTAQDHNIPLATLNTQNATTGTFNVTVKAPAPSALLPGYKIGPGVGITCLQRSGGPKTGTANGALSTDWTGAGQGTYNGQTVYFYNYWYTGCSLDNNVSAAEFYGVVLGPQG